MAGGKYFGMPDWIRTSGLWSRSPTLYPTELRARMSGSGRLSLSAGAIIAEFSPAVKPQGDKNFYFPPFKRFRPISFR